MFLSGIIMKPDSSEFLIFSSRALRIIHSYDGAQQLVTIPQVQTYSPPISIEMVCRPKEHPVAGVARLQENNVGVRHPVVVKEPDFLKDKMAEKMKPITLETV